jgi:Cu/Ag efflux pump CusA
MFGIVVNNSILLINRFRIQVREILEEEGVPTGNRAGEVAEKRRLGGFDLWRLETAERQRILQKAIVDGTRIQMRSILLTSGTTIAGLLPLLYKKDASAGKDIWENLALSSIGGLGSSTVLILMGIPALYWAFTRLGWSMARTGSSALKPSAPTTPPEVAGLPE